MRKTTLTCLAVALLLALTGCGVDELDNFDVTVKENAVIPAATVVETLLGGFPQLDAFTEFDLTESATFRNKNYSPSDVDSVLLESLTMTVVSPDGQDLSFFGTVIFFVETEGLPKKEVARAEMFPEGVSSVRFDTTNDDLKNYLLAKEATMTVEVEDTSRPERETTVEVKAVFDIDVNVL